MREQAGLAPYQFRHRGEIGEGSLVTEPGQCLARRGVPQFGLVAQREQRLMTSGARAGCRNRENLIGVEVSGFVATRWMGEGAIVADVAAELGQRDEDLARIRDEIAMPCVAQ